jgi:hypothetical protein
LPERYISEQKLDFLELETSISSQL